MSVIEAITTLQEETKKKETTEFIELLSGLNPLEKAEVKGYINCLRTVKILVNLNKQKEQEEEA